ncbi:MAG: tyrosine-type recombinase/integrase [Cyanobacteria bacterium]|nr:tyrosine-type recombinase/integrase [Cyanobacteriota bacterium]
MMLKTIGELIDHYVRKPMKTAEATAWSLQHYAGHLLEFPLETFSPMDAEALHHQISQRAPIQANRVIQALKAAWNRGINWRVCPSPNPFSVIELNPETTKYPSMRWEQVDMDSGIWTIPKTKNGTPHAVPLGELEIALLRSRQNHTPWVFPGKRNENHWKWPYKSWRRFVRQAGMPDLHIHDLRRSLGCAMADLDINASTIQAVLNHKSLATTLKIYALAGKRKELEARRIVQETWLGISAERWESPFTSEPNRSAQTSPSGQPEHRDAKLSAADQIIVEGKILAALHSGARTKRQLYKRIDPRFKIDSTELERILDELIERGLAIRYYDSVNGCSWRFACADPV